MEMANNYEILKRSVMWAFFLCFISACQPTGNDAEKKDSSDQGLVFSESSIGLPKAGMWRNGISLYDVNGDGLLDISAPPARKAAAADDIPFGWLQEKGGTWREMRYNVQGEGFFDYGGIAVSDFNGDGVADLVLAMHMKPVTVLLGKKEGGFEEWQDGLPAFDLLTGRAVLTNDFNNDGLMDFAVSSEAKFRRMGYVPKGVWVCLQEGNGWKCDPIDDSREIFGLFGDQMSMGDVNGDGIQDIAVASLNGRVNRIVSICDGKGGFTPFNGGLPKGKIFFAVSLADVNRDGRDDLVASISGFGKNALYGPRVFLSGAEGFKEMSEGLPEKEFITALQGADLDGDGEIEIIAGTGKGGIVVFGRSGKVWKEKNVAGLPHAGLERIYNIYCRDVNNDGKKDIIFNHALETNDSGGIHVFLNKTEKKLSSEEGK